MASHLFIDSGSLFFKPNHQDKSTDVALAKSLAIIECLNFMHYDAIGLSTHDLQLGIHFLKKLETEATFPFLSANIVDTTSGALAFTPYTTVKKGNVHVGIIGITGDAATDADSSFTIQNWQTALNRTLEQLPADIDIIVLLSNLSHNDNIRVAKQYPDIPIILESGQSSPARQLQLTDNTIITHTPKEGKYVGELKIDWHPAKLWGTPDRSLIELKNEIDRLNWFKSRIEKRGGASETYKDNPTALDDYNKKMNHLQTLQTELARRTEQKEESKDIVYSTYQQILHPLKPTIVDEPQTAEILKNSRKATQSLRRNSDILKRFDVYSGSKSCQQCHKSIYSTYQKTRHATAYRTLVNKSDDNNPNCVFCHVTGLPERLAYLQTQIPERLQQVGCETCHGPGKQHIQEPQTYKLTQSVPATTCLICHTEDHSDDFNYPRDVGLVH